MTAVTSALIAAVFLACPAVATKEGPSPVPRPPGRSTRVLFGSCNRAQWSQPLWKHVLARSPDAWIWAGDNVYGDRTEGIDWSTGKIRAHPATEERLGRLYAAQLAHPGYAQLLRSNATILATWDDHDYGLNDGDRTFHLRRASQRRFLDFVREPALSARRLRDGVYASRILPGPPVPIGEGAPAQSAEAAGQRRQSTKRHAQRATRSGVLVVLLDNRFNKDPYDVGPGGDMLGEAQWRWPERTLRASRARAHLIVSGLQVLPFKRVGEGWGRFPASRARLLALLHRLRVPAPILISGDVHMAELHAARCAPEPREVAPADSAPAHWLRLWPSMRLARHRLPSRSSTVFEVTSSGMTHSWASNALPNLHAGPVADGLNAFLMHSGMAFMPWRYRQRADTGRAGSFGPGYFLGRNFGQVDFAWDAPGGPEARVSIVDEYGRAAMTRVWRLSDLDLTAHVLDGSGITGASKPFDGSGEDGKEFEWVCRPHGGGAVSPSDAEMVAGFALWLLCMGLFGIFLIISVLVAIAPASVTVSLARRIDTDM